MANAQHSRYLLFVLLLGVGCQSNSQSDPAVDNGTRGTPEVYPIVDASEHQLFGASRNGEWLTAVQAADFIHADQRYRLYRFTDSLGMRAGSGLEPPGETCTNPAVRLHNLPENGRDLIAVAGSWNALPRVPASQDTAQQAYRKFIADYLRRQGIESPDVNLDQILRIDLEGDGEEEVLIAANRLRGSATMALAGDYAVVLLRKLIDGEVRQIPLEEEYYPEECIAECAPSSFRIAAVLDVNGDGIMEVITGFRYFEGRGKRIHAIGREKTDPVLSWRCGA